MTSTTKIYLTLAIIAILGIFATAVCARPFSDARQDKSQFKNRMGQMGKIGEKLGVTDDQKDQIIKIVRGYREDFGILAEGMIDANRELQDAVTADSYNESDIRKASQDIGDYREEMAVLAGKVYQDVSKVLTPAQLETIKDLKDMRRRHVDDFINLMKSKDLAKVEEYGDAFNLISEWSTN